MINLDIPAGSGSAKLGRCGLKSTWNSDDVAIEIELRSNLVNRIKFHIDPQADYDEITRWTSFSNTRFLDWLGRGFSNRNCGCNRTSRRRA